MEVLLLGLNGLSLLLGIGSLVCFVMIIVKMFQAQLTGIAVTCIVTLFICGIGGLIAFIFGWMKSEELQAKKIMMIWTALVVVNIIISGIVFALGASMQM
jgi:hypothetical protein